MRLMRDRVPRVRKCGRTEFWADRHHRLMAIMVECDDPSFPVIAAFRFSSRKEETEVEKKANLLIRQIKLGKVDYRLLARRIPQEFSWHIRREP